VSTMDTHPETALVPFAKDELAPDERARVKAHLVACEACRRALADVRAVLVELAAAPAPPAPHWGRYRVELRARIDARARAPRRWQRPMPIAVSAGLAAALLLFVLWPPAPVEQRPVDLAALDEAVIGARLDMLEHYDVVERLDLLEELDVIRALDIVPLRDGG
jgi:anti-sigma factor RsiW